MFLLMVLGSPILAEVEEVNIDNSEDPMCYKDGDCNQSTPTISKMVTCRMLAFITGVCLVGVCLVD